MLVHVISRQVQKRVTISSSCIFYIIKYKIAIKIVILTSLYTFATHQESEKDKLFCLCISFCPKLHYQMGASTCYTAPCSRYNPPALKQIGSQAIKKITIIHTPNRAPANNALLTLKIYFYSMKL